MCSMTSQLRLTSVMLVAATSFFSQSAPAQAAEEAVILTPPPGPQPRINGARVFGVRPGRPLLYTIAATGRRPGPEKGTFCFSVTETPARWLGDTSAWLRDALYRFVRIISC